MRFLKVGQASLLAIVVTVPAIVLGPAVPAAAAPAPVPDRSARVTEADVLAALQRDLHLTAEQAARLVRQQTAALAANRALDASLGADFGGSWFDAKSGKLVVSVTKASRAAEVTARGAEVRVVERGERALGKITDELDRLAGRAAGGARKAAPGPRDAALAGVVGWHADPRTDKVVVTALRGTPKAAALAKYGDALRMEYVDSAPRAAANFMDGGDLLNGGRCSAGFNLRNPSTGQGYLLTVGHCFNQGENVFGQGGVYFGPTLESFFPTWDDALIRNDNPAYWIQGPWVDVSPSNGGVLTVSGSTDAPVGTTVCKSGITTLLTCGYITVMRETVTYVGGLTVYGLKRHSACVELGDSGGANFAVTSSYTAEGVTSGAILYGSNYQCGQDVGQPNTSWYYPIVSSLPYYGPKYSIALW